MSGYRFDRMKILVVDDNVHMRKLVVTILQAFGVGQILEAESAERAWEMMPKANPDIAIVDWVMAGMSGIDLVKMMRTSPQSPNPFVPVIILTGHTNIDHVRQARDAGANEFLAKPVSVTAMMTRMVAAIENPRPFVRTVAYFGPCRRRRQLAYQGPERRGGAAIGADANKQVAE